jgi:hypothetical protein
MNYRSLQDAVEAVINGHGDASLLSILNPHKPAFLDLFREYKVRTQRLGLLPDWRGFSTSKYQHRFAFTF